MIREWTLETLSLTTALSAGFRSALEYAEYLIARNSESETSDPIVGWPSAYATQPSDLGEGLQHAYASLASELGQAAHRLVAVPWREFQRGGAGAYAASLASGVPVAILRPAIGASDGVAKALLGATNALDPQRRQEGRLKYKLKGPRGESIETEQEPDGEEDDEGEEEEEDY